MKKFLYLILIALISVSCAEEEDVFILNEANPLAHFSTTSYSETAVLTEAGQVEVSTVVVSVIGEAPSSDLNLTVSVAESSTAVQGLHYRLPSEQVTISAGEYSAELSYEILLDGFEGPDDVRNLNLTLGGAATEGVSPSDLTANVALGITCPIPASVYGTYSVTTVDTNPAGCSGVTNEVTLTAVEESTTGIQITDITGGLYKNCYGAEDNPGQIIYNCGNITVSGIVDVVYGDDEFNGQGSYDLSNNTMVITWSNGFGDSGTSTFVKQ